MALEKNIEHSEENQNKTEDRQPERGLVAGQKTDRIILWCSKQARS